MLVCDHCLRKCCHMYCLEPALEEIPHEPWYCDFCRRDHEIRSILPSANLFEPPEPEPRARLRRVAPSNHNTSRATSIASRGVSLPRSNRSNSGTSRRDRQNRQQPVRNARNLRPTRPVRLQTVHERQNNTESSSEDHSADQADRFQFNHNFQRQTLNRPRPNNRRNNQGRQPANNSRRQAQAPHAASHSNPFPVRRMQFSSRTNPQPLALQAFAGNVDRDAFNDEFRESTASPNLNPSTRERGVQQRPPQEENFF
jgi:hypothetical protein